MTDINTQVNRVALGMALEDLEKFIYDASNQEDVYRYDEMGEEFKVVDDYVANEPIYALLRELYRIHPEYRPSGSRLR